MKNEGYKKTKECYVIAIDFDGTIVSHEYPDIGTPIPYAKEVINFLTNNGHQCFLFTMRDGKELHAAKEYCQSSGIPLVGYNESPDQFSTSPKQYGTFYIDDAAVGCPLGYDKTISNRPYVNWYDVAIILSVYGLITDEQLNSIRDGRTEK